MTTVLVVGFVSAGMMSVRQSVGMIMGAEIGTTVTAQIIAFKVTSYALIAVAGGFALQLFSRRERTRQDGLMIFGVGLILFGMFIVGEAMTPLRTYEPFIELMRSMDNPLLAILVSAAFTALVQSSSATTAVVITLANSGFISLEAGIALVFGANIGTCAPAMLAAIGKPREALQAAFVQRIVPIHPEEAPEQIRPKYLDDNLLSTPALAFERVVLELRRTGEKALEMIRRAPHAVISGDFNELDELEKIDDDVDVLHDETVACLGRLSSEDLTASQSEKLHDHFAIANYIENMADIIETNLISIGRERLANEVRIQRRDAPAPNSAAQARHLGSRTRSHLGRRVGSGDRAVGHRREARGRPSGRRHLPTTRRTGRSPCAPSPAGVSNRNRTGRGPQASTIPQQTNRQGRGRGRHVLSVRQSGGSKEPLTRTPLFGLPLQRRALKQASVLSISDVNRRAPAPLLRRARRGIEDRRFR